MMNLGNLIFSVSIFILTLFTNFWSKGQNQKNNYFDTFLEKVDFLKNLKII